MSLDSLKQQIEQWIGDARKTYATARKENTQTLRSWAEGRIQLGNDVLELVGDLEKTLQEQIRHMIREAENDEIADVRVGCYSLAEKFGLKVKKDEYGEYYLDEGDVK